MISVRSGRALDISYDEGTVGVIEIEHSTGEIERKIRFTRSTVFDFSYFSMANWEVLTHCEVCNQPAMETELSRCDTCQRPGYCPNCIDNHKCLVPAIGVSREPRHVKGQTK